MIRETISRPDFARLYTDKEVERIIEKACILINAFDGKNSVLEDFLCQVTTLGTQYMDLTAENERLIVAGLNLLPIALPTDISGRNMADIARKIIHNAQDNRRNQK